MISIKEFFSFFQKIFIATFFVAIFTLNSHAIEVPALTGPVIDQAEILTPNQAHSLAQYIYEIKSTKGPQFQIVILSTLAGESIEDVAYQIFSSWKLGDQKRDDGLLIVVAPKEKRVRIEIGQGLEGDIPDVVASRVIREVMRPYFKSGDFFSGLVSALQVLGQRAPSDTLKSQFNQQSQSTIQKAASSGSNFFVYLILAGIWLVIFFINPRLAINILFFALNSSGRGSSSGRSWGGGGGSSSGGGASGGW